MAEALLILAISLVIAILSLGTLMRAATVWRDADAVRREGEANKAWADARHTEAAMAEERAERLRAEWEAEIRTLEVG